MKILIFILSVTCFFTKTSYSQFELIETFTTAGLGELHKLDSSVLILGDNNYDVRYTNDEIQSINIPGPSENVIHHYNNIGINKGFITSSFPGLSSTDHNYIYKTNDNCQTWEEVFDTIDVKISNLTFFDSLEGIFTSLPGRQFRTTDGGYTWNLESCFDVVDAIETYEDSIICIGGLEKFAISYDRGRTWLYRSFMQNNYPNSIDFISKDTILVSSGGYFSKTYNAGLDWVHLYNGFNVTKVIHKDDVIYMIGRKSLIDEFGNYIGHGTILKSNDLGATWTTCITDYITMFTDIEFLNDSVALICGTNGILLKYFYRDHGLGFNKLEKENSLVSIYPNPTSNFINIEGENLTKAIILNQQGQKIKEIIFENTFTDQTIDLGKLDSGVYFVEIENNTGNKKVEKIFKIGD